MSDSKTRLPWHTEPKVDHQAATVRALSAARSRGGDPTSAVVKAYAQRAFDTEVDKVRNAPPGQRNLQLFKSAANLYELVAAQALSEADVAGALRDACDANGLTRDDGSHAVEATLASGRRKGLDQPRDLAHVGTGTNGFVLDDAPVTKTVSLSGVFDLERGFWDSRESLRTIYLGALARMCAPWAVLGYCAARALASVRPHITLPALIGGPGSLNWFCAVAATSGGGKSSAEAVARELVSVPVLTRNLGSGEGMIDAYVRPANKETGEPKGQHESVMFLADEIDTMQALATRSSSTLLPILRTGFGGATIGFSYRQASNIHLKEHSYRMTLVANIQPARAGALMDDEEGGTLQRFMWFPGHDPRITTEVPLMPPPLDITPQHEWLYARPLVIPYEAIELIRDERARRAQTEASDELRGDLDGHSMYIREKFAMALAVLDGRDEMSYDDWFLAGIASKVSDYTRRYVRDKLEQAREEDAAKKGKLQGVSLLASDDERTGRVARRKYDTLKWIMKKLREDGPLTKRELSLKCPKDYRPYQVGVLDQAVQDGLIAEQDGTNKTGPKSKVYRVIE